MTKSLTIADLRAEMGLTLEEFGKRIGLASKGGVSAIEASNRCSLRVALSIESLSGGRIDAGAINEDVKAAREAVGHDGNDMTVPVTPSPGKSNDISPSPDGDEGDQKERTAA